MAIEALKERESLAELSKRFDVQPTVISKWAPADGSKHFWRTLPWFLKRNSFKLSNSDEVKFLLLYFPGK